MKYHCVILKSEFYRVEVEIECSDKKIACKKAMDIASLMEDAAWKYLDCEYTSADCVTDEEWQQGERPEL